MGQKRKSYSAAYKLQVVKYAAENGNRPAERKFGVNEKLVRDWRKAKDALKAMKKTKKANRGLKPRWPQLEEQVHKWVLEQRSAGRGLTKEQLRLHAKVVATAMNISDFAGGPSWCNRFMQRHRLTMRAGTSATKGLPAELQDKVHLLREFLDKQVTEHSVKVEVEEVKVEVEEVPVMIDMDPSVDEKVQSRMTTEDEKPHLTVVLACCGDGSKLPPMVIFKQQTTPKIESPFAVDVNESKKAGWIKK